MKRLLLLAAFLLWPWTVRAQDDTLTIYWVGDSLKPTDSVLVLCKERGHLWAQIGDDAGYNGEMVATYVDLVDRTIRVTTCQLTVGIPCPDHIEGCAVWHFRYEPCQFHRQCRRCGEWQDYTMADTTVIWQKPDTTLPIRGGDDGIYWGDPIWYNPADFRGPMDTVLSPIEDSLDDNH